MKSRDFRPQDTGLVGRLFAAFILVAASAGYANAADVCRVDVGASGDGSNWSSPMDLKSALDTPSCSEIWVKAGTYETGSTDSFEINRELGLYGGFAGTETSRDGRDPSAHVTTLADSYLVTVLSIRATAGTAITSSTVIDGFIITRGDGYEGGGMICQADGPGSECSPVISNVVFSANYAESAGGAMMIKTLNGGVASPTLTNVTFSDNLSVIAGGAVEIQSSGASSPIFYNVTFSGNTATNSGRGGTLHMSGNVNASLFNATFKGNDALNGGAINTNLPASSSLTLNSVILWGNTPQGGAQITNVFPAQVTISHSVVQDAFSGGAWNTGLGFDGGGNLQTDPMLGALGNHGGFTDTFLPGFGSSAADTGSDQCKSVGGLAFDQRGMPRPQGADCDIGSVEVPYATSLTIGSVGGSGSVSATANPLLLSGGIAACDGTIPANCSADYAQNISVQLNATPEPNSSFVGWGGDCSGTGIHFSLVMDAVKNCSAVFAADPDAALSATIGDARDYAQAGQLLTYGIAVDNSGGLDANAVGVDDTLPAQLDDANALWQCLPTHGATCAATGTGNISDTINLPAHSSAFYVLTVPVKSGASGSVANEIGVSSSNGTITASDTTTLVLFRNGFEVGGDGSQGLVGTQAVVSLDGLSGSSAIALPVDVALPPRKIATLAASADGAIRVQAIRIGQNGWLRLLTRNAGVQRASPWSALSGQAAIVELYADSDGSKHVLLSGTRTAVSMPMP